MGCFRAYIAEQDEDSKCYNILARTKKDMVRQMKERDATNWTRAAYCEVPYSDLHDLVDKLTCEGGCREIDWTFEVIREYDVDELLGGAS